MATKLLPAVKRYAVSTEPVREAAKVTLIYLIVVNETQSC
jgi:hypothetical protein